jgi:molybdopterin-guanine dinucleotide biosynthesis protein A
VTVTAIVLAGGRSTRFGADKLAAKLGATSVLAATIEAVATVADRIVVAGPSAPDRLSVGGIEITVAPDAEADRGPLAALAGVLGSLPVVAAPGPDAAAIIVGGDMPRLVSSVLVRMLDELDVDPTVDGVYLGTPATAEASGAPTGISPIEPSRRQVLPLAVRVQPAERAAREAVRAGRRSLQSLVEAMAAIELPAAAWLPLDPDALTLTDVDTRRDLDRLGAR